MEERIKKVMPLVADLFSQWTNGVIVNISIKHYWRAHQNTANMFSWFKDPLNRVRLVIFFQSLVDFVLNVVIGYTTKYGWKKDKELSLRQYTKSARIVSKMGLIRKIC